MTPPCQCSKSLGAAHRDHSTVPSKVERLDEEGTAQSQLQARAEGNHTGRRESHEPPGGGISGCHEREESRCKRPCFFSREAKPVQQWYCRNALQPPILMCNTRQPKSRICVLRVRSDCTGDHFHLRRKHKKVVPGGAVPQRPGQWT